MLPYGEKQAAKQKAAKLYILIFVKIPENILHVLFVYHNAVHFAYSKIVFHCIIFQKKEIALNQNALAQPDVYLQL